MRSLIILEIEHGETTDPIAGLVQVIDHMAIQPNARYGFRLNDYTIRVDLPECFELKG